MKNFKKLALLALISMPGAMLASFNDQDVAHIVGLVLKCKETQSPLCLRIKELVQENLSPEEKNELDASLQGFGKSIAENREKKLAEELELKIEENKEGGTLTQALSEESISEEELETQEKESKEEEATQGEGSSEK